MNAYIFINRQELEANFQTFQQQKNNMIIKQKELESKCSSRNSGVYRPGAYSYSTGNSINSFRSGKFEIFLASYLLFVYLF